MTTEQKPVEDWRAYRCPVCGHTDGVALPGAEGVTIRCSHCATPLEVRRKGTDSVAVTVDGTEGPEAGTPNP